MISRLVLLISLFIAFGAQGASIADCSARLTGDPFFGAMVAGYKSGAVRAEHFARAAASETPINPLAFETGTSVTSAAKKVLGQLAVSDTVAKTWPETRKHLKEFLRELSGDQTASEDAARATARVIAPALQGTVEDLPHSSPFTVMPNGDIVYAQIAEGHVVVTKLSDRSVIFKQDSPFPKDYLDVLAFHHDAGGKTWLYFAGQKDPARRRSNALEAARVFRVDIAQSTTPIQEIPTQLDAESVLARMEDTGGVLLFEVTNSVNYQTFNLANGTLEPIAQTRHYETTLRGGQHLRLERADDRLWANLDGKEFELSHKRGPDQTWLLTAYKAKNGHIYVVYFRLNFPRSDQNMLDIWDLEHGHKPLHHLSWQGTHIGSPHWFETDDGMPVLGVLNNELKLLDPETGTFIFAQPFAMGIPYWFGNEHDVYINIQHGRTARIFGIFSHSNRGPDSVNDGHECEARLSSANRYFGAFAAAMKSGALSAQDLATACASAAPVNPLAIATPGSRNSSARTLFASLINDPEVNAQWPATLELLKRLREKAAGEEYNRAEASTQTQEVLGPTLIQTIPQGKPTVVFTSLSDGTLVVAGLVGKQIVMSRLSDMAELHRVDIPYAEWGLDRYAWHRDERGTTWLYFVQASEYDRVYRLNFDLRGQFELLPQMYDRGLRVSQLIPVSPKVLLAKVSVRRKSFNINILSEDTEFSKGPRSTTAGGYAVATNGELIIPENPPEGSVRIFPMRDGRLLKISTGGSRSTFSAELDGVKEDFQLPISPQAHAAYQTKSGRILIAYLSGGSSDSRVNFYEFGIGSETPFYSPKFKRENKAFEWFENADGHAYLATAGEQVLRVIDPLGHEVPVRLEPKRRPTFFRVDGKLYWLVQQEDGTKVYKMFIGPTRGPSSVDCEARLTASDRFAAAFAAVLESGVLTAEDLAAVTASEVPINPLAHQTPGSRNSSARALLATLLEDPHVIANWPATREKLKALAAKLAADDKVRDSGHRATAKILNPSLLGSHLSEGPSTSVAALADGTVVSAHFLGQEVIISRVSDGEALHAWPGLPFENQTNRWLTFHRDGSDKLWLHTVSVNKGQFHVQRIDPENTLAPVTQGQVPLAQGVITGIRAVDRGAVLAEVRASLGKFGLQFWNIENAVLNDVSEAFYDPLRVSTPLPQGLTLGHIGINEKSIRLAYVTPTGRKLKLTAGRYATYGSILTISELHHPSAPAHEFKIVNPTHRSVDWEIDKIFLYEADNGRVLLAVQLQCHAGVYYEFFALDAGPDPIYLHNASANSYMPTWFTGPASQPVFAYAVAAGESSYLNIVDPESKSILLKNFKFLSGKDVWSIDRGHSYLSATHNRDGEMKTHIFDMYGEVPP